ncbi:MAG: phosphate acyltransferase PlsX [Candidatus Limnocylindrales bacterium]|jgi:glycerol-3-phosphate acyltransferase PlsX
MDLTTVRTVSGGSVRVAVDAMGGDHAPLEVVAGSLSWARAHPADAVLLVGIPERIRDVADGPILPNVEIVGASQVVEMDEPPALALKAKKDSSIMVAMDLIKGGRADVLVTAGHSGAGMAAAVLKLGRLPGVDRPALAVQMVTETGPFVLLDIGANMDSNGNNLYQFAHMGSLYAERVLGVDKPRIALLSIGEEKGKGDLAIQQATQMLDEDGSLNFIGNVEGRDLVKHMADVAVCDAVVGNVTMKFFEGLAGFIFGVWRQEFERGIRGKLAYLLMRPGVGRIRTLFDYEKLGASPLLGVNGMVLITHGSAKRRMIEFAVEAGAGAARAHIPDLIADAFRGRPRRIE